jgi:muramoyltetrapeptide carboxypeptidase LdcA involved in peptidoglycan recycling
MIHYPPPLQQGDTIGITAPSAGVGPELEERLQFCISTLRQMGFQLRIGECLRGDAIVSAPVAKRATELMSMLLDDSIKAILPPWGGEILIDLLPLIDFDALKRSTPKWIIGYSDLTTLMLPYTLLTHVASVHGSILLETPNSPAGELAHWHTVVALPAGASFDQRPPSHYQANFVDWRSMPQTTRWQCSEPVVWKCLHHEDDPHYAVEVTGRLIGGCLDVISMLPASRFGDVPRFARECAPEGLLLYLENADGNTAQFCRMLHCIRLAGWCEHANAILIGRSGGPQLREFTLRDCLLDALGQLTIPVIYDMDIGHVPPQLILINGALGTLRFGRSEHRLTQGLR